MVKVVGESPLRAGDLFGREEGSSLDQVALHQLWQTVGRLLLALANDVQIGDKVVVNCRQKADRQTITDHRRMSKSPHEAASMQGNRLRVFSVLRGQLYWSRFGAKCKPPAR